jgi:hypothetical protein
LAITAPNGLSKNHRLALSFAIIAAVVLNWIPTFDIFAQHYLTDTISSNAIVFTMARTLNGVISVVQSAELSVGVASVNLGEIFDPINDLIERFSGLLLISLTALGIQQVILLLTTSLALKVIFSIYATVILILLWQPTFNTRSIINVGIVILMLRFLLNIEVSLVWLFDWLYFNATGAEALSVLQASTQVLVNIKTSITEIDISKFIFGNDAPIADSETISSQISTSVVTLIVGILFKSMIIPIGTLWLGYKISLHTLIRRSS